MAGGPLTPEPATDTSRRRSVDDTAQVARLRWGAIWAGVLIALTAFLLLELLVFGISLVSAADRPGNSRDEDWVSGIIGLIVFFIGGYVASKASAAEDVSAARDARAGLLDGLLVWALGSVLILTLSALGAGQIFGALGDVVGQSCALGDPTTTIEPSRIAGTIRSSAVGAFFTLLLWALASAIGGWLADRTGRTAVLRGLCYTPSVEAVPPRTRLQKRGFKKLKLARRLGDKPNKREYAALDQKYVTRY